MLSLFCERIFCEHPRCLDTPTIIHSLSTYLYVRPLFFSFERGPKRDQEGYYFSTSTILCVYDVPMMFIDEDRSYKKINWALRQNLLCEIIVVGGVSLWKEVLYLLFDSLLQRDTPTPNISEQ